jgi:hypothetical protein
LDGCSPAHFHQGFLRLSTNPMQIRLSKWAGDGTTRQHAGALISLHVSKAESVFCEAAGTGTPDSPLSLYPPGQPPLPLDLKTAGSTPPSEHGRAATASSAGKSESGLLAGALTPCRLPSSLSEPRPCLHPSPPQVPPRPPRHPFQPHAILPFHHPSLLLLRLYCSWPANDLVFWLAASLLPNVASRSPLQRPKISS